MTTSDPAGPAELTQRTRATWAAGGYPAAAGCASWDLRESGPPGAEHAALLLPGGMCTAMFYTELMAEPALAGVRLVAATLPGHGGTMPPRDLSIENCARLMAGLAADLGCDVVVGHSMGANVALEMAASGAFAGPVVLGYLDRYGSVAARLGEAGVPAWVVHGERGDGGVTDTERRTLEACPLINLITIPGASYFTPNEEPALVAGLVAEAIGRAHAPS